MTGKNIFAGLALVLFAAALFVFFHHGDSKIIVQEASDRPKVMLYQYEYYRVKDDVETARMLGKQADLMDGGLVLLREGLRGVRTRDGRREEVTANSADVELSGSTPGQLASSAQAKKAKLYGDVVVTSGDARFESDEVHYSEEASLMHSQKPARVVQNTQIIYGKGGFDYQIDKEILKMRGGVSGTLLPKELSKAQKTGKSP